MTTYPFSTCIRYLELACLQKKVCRTTDHQVRYVTGVPQGTGNDFTLFSCRVGRVKKILEGLVIFSGEEGSRGQEA